MTAHQRIIRDREALIEPRVSMSSLDGCGVRAVSLPEAEAIILRYEWLGSMATQTIACYGLDTPHGLAGVVCLGHGPGSNSDYLCGPEHAAKAICLARGACVHWAHPHAASFLISRACALAAKQYGWRIFYAYSDRMAGEIGTVYQACNWTYIGIGVGRGDGQSGRWFFRHLPTGVWWSTKQLRAVKADIPGLRTNPDWEPQWRPDKGRYVHFEGDRRERRDLRAQLRYAPQPYPKRQTHEKTD